MDQSEKTRTSSQRAGGIAALYLGAAYATAMAYFLLIANYPDISDPEEKIAFLAGNIGGMYAINMISYIGFGFALMILSLSFHERVKERRPFLARMIVCAGLAWACLLIASGTVFNMGMESVVNLAAADPQQASASWRTIEAIANGLGGAGGEILGGPWLFLLGLCAILSRTLPKALAWSGLAIGAAGILSILPPLREAAYIFGLLQIPFCAWLGITLLSEKRAR